jgi:hypothetical protein
MIKKKSKPENLMKKEYLESFKELKNFIERSQVNPDISNLACCSVKEHEKELLSILKARQRLEEFKNVLDQEV